MKCIQCEKEFDGVRVTAKYCSDACKMAFQRKNVTVSEVSVTNDQIKSDNIDTTTPSEVSLPHRADTKGFNKWDTELNKEKNPLNPLKRITKTPSQTVDDDYWISKTYKNLIEELELKNIDQLEKEDYFIPAWKYCGKYTKMPIISEMMK